MNFRFKFLIFLLTFFYTFIFCNDEIIWQELEEGISYSRVNIYKGDEIIDVVNLLKISPVKFYFKIYYKEKEKGWPEMYNIKEWHEKYPDIKIFINGSYYDKDRRPTTAIWQEWKCINRKQGVLNKGAMLCCFTDEKNNIYMDLIDLNKNPVDVAKDKFYYAIQSMPTLISSGEITVKKSDWQANRTILAKDKEGNILIIVTEGYANYRSFTLYDISKWLLKQNLNIVLAVNLDGGYESQLSIKTKDFKYITIGQWETDDTGDISKPGIKIKLPVAIGFYGTDVK